MLVGLNGSLIMAAHLLTIRMCHGGVKCCCHKMLAVSSMRASVKHMTCARLFLTPTGLIVPFFLEADPTRPCRGLNGGGPILHLSMFGLAHH
jgi:hypothetical protein